ncbi:cation transporter [Sedimentibacter sp.]|uniref:cation transporter n=1 Tax=Sedimentibacter sp. TaxID=1960295 RepID=UPI00289CDBEA|nr:cation transporter [Sedimentibacter sp.]
MKKKFVLEGLDCANCAAKIENDINKIDGVESASINLMTTKLTIEAAEDKMQEIADTAKKIVNKYEPDVIFRTA